MVKYKQVQKQGHKPKIIGDKLRKFHKICCLDQLIQKQKIIISIKIDLKYESKIIFQSQTTYILPSFIYFE